ncbi:ISNCY family transposase [Hippea jasoniae]|uniref:ISNCY family transposase n=1 Tax=Hippea jasoniae TaxID=944479 RepID=UPI00068D253E|nr:ISNCY family transposase [Hippea jasoniae]
MEEHYLMSRKELERATYMGMVLKGSITLKEASEILRISYRHSKRILKRFRQEEERGLIHRSRGRRSPKRIDDYLRDKIASLYKENYSDFSISLFKEKLFLIHNITLSRETIRTILKEYGVYKSRKARRNSKSVHVFRERKRHAGELIQVDGSTHRWLEDRCKDKFTLMGYIDDATGEIFAKFYDYEGVYSFLDSFLEFVKINGLPKSIYTDRHSTYKTTRKPTIQEELKNKRPATQVERILKRVGVELIHAYSPQAKGRIERLFKTLQDRLIKEMRLKGIKTKEEANCFLKEYIPLFNKQFAKQPKSNISLFKKLDKDFDYEWEFALESQRNINNDYTIRYKGRLFQIKDVFSVRRKQKVLIKESIYGPIRVFYKDRELQIEEVNKKETSSICKISLNHSFISSSFEQKEKEK